MAEALPAAGGAGDSGAGLTADSDGAGATSGVVARYKSFYLNGGYVSAGVGLRNLGSGTIGLNGIPSGALSLAPMSVITPLVLGFVVTVFSAWAPARFRQ